MVRRIGLTVCAAAMLSALVALTPGSIRADTVAFFIGSGQPSQLPPAEPVRGAPSCRRSCSFLQRCPHTALLSSFGRPTHSPAKRTVSPGKCWRRSTGSRPTSARTWALARLAPSAGCSFCRPLGRSGEPTRAETAWPTRRTRRMQSSRPLATSLRPARSTICTRRSSRTTTPTGTSSTSSTSRQSTAAARL